MYKPGRRHSQSLVIPLILRIRNRSKSKTVLPDPGGKPHYPETAPQFGTCAPYSGAGDRWGPPHQGLMPQTYSGGGPDYAGTPHIGIGGREHGHRFHKDEPPRRDGEKSNNSSRHLSQNVICVASNNTRDEGTTRFTHARNRPTNYRLLDHHR